MTTKSARASVAQVRPACNAFNAVTDPRYRRACRNPDCLAAVGKPCTYGDTRKRRFERANPHPGRTFGRPEAKGPDQTPPTR